MHEQWQKHIDTFEKLPARIQEIHDDLERLRYECEVTQGPGPEGAWLALGNLVNALVMDLSGAAVFFLRRAAHDPTLPPIDEEEGRRRLELAALRARNEGLQTMLRDEHEDDLHDEEERP
jgi:hypothetical protein